MRAPRPAPAPYTPKRALNSGSSAGAAAALGAQKLAGKNDLFAFSSAFLTGYLAGIPLGRFELHGAFTSLTEHVMAAQSYTAFWSVWCSWFAAAFLQASLIYLCGFHLWGSNFYGGLFCIQGHCIRCVCFRHLCVRRGTCACCLLAPELPAGACAVDIHALACA